MIPPSASTRGQNRPPRPPLGGGGPHLIYFWATGRLCTTTHCKSELPRHEHGLATNCKNSKPQMAIGAGRWLAKNAPSDMNYRAKQVPSTPPWGPEHPQCSIFRPMGATSSCWHSGTVKQHPGTFKQHHARVANLITSPSPSGSPLSLPSKLESPIPQHPSLSLLSCLPLFTAPACMVLFLGSVIARKSHDPHNACSCRMSSVFSFHQMPHPKPR
jgi:hypothetical protein